MKADPPPPRPVHAPVLITPANNATVQAQGRSFKVKLAWKVPKHQSSERSYVEVVARDGGTTREVFSGYVGGSQTMVRLPSVSGRYFWRVYATASGSAHYAPSGWGDFTVGGAVVDQ